MAIAAMSAPRRNECELISNDILKTIGSHISRVWPVVNRNCIIVKTFDFPLSQRMLRKYAVRVSVPYGTTRDISKSNISQNGTRGINRRGMKTLHNRNNNDLPARIFFSFHTRVKGAQLRRDARFALHTVGHTNTNLLLFVSRFFFFSFYFDCDA